MYGSCAQLERNYLKEMGQQPEKTFPYLGFVLVPTSLSEGNQRDHIIPLRIASALKELLRSTLA